MSSKVIVSFRGRQTEIPLVESLTVGDIRASVARQHCCSKEEESTLSQASQQHEESIKADEIKLLFKGKVLVDDAQNVTSMLVCAKKPKARYLFLATGVSQKEIERADEEMRQHEQHNKILVRDDLSVLGRKKEMARQRRGRNMLAKTRAGMTTDKYYGFGSIDVLPDLPDQDKAREILTTLANDPGVKACMAKHQWNVGSLAELYPEGNVGQSAVCVMGLNKNKGQQIFLRIRTDDLQGFRNSSARMDCEGNVFARIYYGG